MTHIYAITIIGLFAWFLWRLHQQQKWLYLVVTQLKVVTDNTTPKVVPAGKKRVVSDRPMKYRKKKDGFLPTGINEIMRGVESTEPGGGE